MDYIKGAEMKAGGVTVGGLSKTFVIGSFILNIFLAGILQELFAHIHKLQIMIHLVIVNVLIPPHTMLYFNGLLNFITFQIFDFRPLLNRIFDLGQETRMVSVNAWLLGYESTYFISNLSDIFVLFLFTLSCFVFAYGTRNSKNEKLRSYSKKTQNFWKWGGVYQAINMPFIVFVISAIINTCVLTWDNTGVGINNVFFFAGCALVVGFPIFNFFWLRKNKERLNTKGFFAEYGQMYHLLDWQSLRSWTLAEPAINSTRIFLTIASLIYFNNWRTIQIILVLLQHYFVIIYNGVEHPFKEYQYFFFQ